MKIDWLSRDLIAGPHVVLCLSDKAFQAALKHIRYLKPLTFLGTNESAASVHSLISNRGDMVCIVSLSVADSTPIEIAGILVHEAVHVWQAYCEDIGEDSPSAEFEAYSIQAISQRLMESYVKQTQKGAPHAKVNTR